MIFAKVDGKLPQARMHMLFWQNSDMVISLRLDNIDMLEYAAAFFLLADSLKDAVNVCVRNLDDFQLAVAIARVYEGDGGPVLTQIIKDHILPRAAEEGDRWLASWAFWMLGDRGKSVQALIVFPILRLY
jgi:hypothetical protein